MYVLPRGGNTGQLPFSRWARIEQDRNRWEAWPEILRDVKGRVGRIPDPAGFLLRLCYWEGHSGVENGTSRHGVGVGVGVGVGEDR